MAVSVDGRDASVVGDVDPAACGIHKYLVFPDVS